MAVLQSASATRTYLVFHSDCVMQRLSSFWVVEFETAQRVNVGPISRHSARQTCASLLEHPVLWPWAALEMLPVYR